MNITGLVLLGAGYLLGNPAARNKFGSAIQQLIGQGVDALNNMGGDADVSATNTDEKTEQ